MDIIPPTAKKLHPLVATAAVAVIVVSVLGAIVVITDQVAAHRGPDSATVASTDTGAGAPDATAPQNSAAPNPSLPASAAPAAPTHTVTHPVRPAAPAPQVAGLPPPPPGAAGVPPDLAMSAPPAPPVCSDCGIVAAVRPVKIQGQGSGVGAVAGGAVGGLLGNQFGHGSGKTAMTVLGVLGGALGGNQVEKEVNSTTRWYVDVRLDNGQLRTVPVPGNPGPIVGTRVRVENGQLVREAPPQS
jgi:outer membrane lipoprotein SlyB